jgi:transposase
MRAKQNQNPEAIVKDIRRQTRRKFTAEEKIRIVLEGLKGEASISEVCRREGIVSNLYYRWSKDFLEAGKKRLQGDTVREASSTEAIGLRQENEQLKQLVAELSLKYRLVKKSLTGLEFHSRNKIQPPPL